MRQKDALQPIDIDKASQPAIGAIDLDDADDDGDGRKRQRQVEQPDDEATAGEGLLPCQRARQRQAEQQREQRLKAPPAAA